MPKQTKRIRVSREACSNEAADSAKLMRMGFSKEVCVAFLVSHLFSLDELCRSTSLLDDVFRRLSCFGSDFVDCYSLLQAALTALASNGGCGFDAALAFLARQAAREEVHGRRVGAGGASV